MIEVACSCDRHYLKYCLAMLYSLFDNHRKVSLRVHLLGDGLTEEDFSKVRCVAESRGMQLCTYSLDSSLLDSLPKGQYGYISPATYARIFLAELLPQELQRVIYLDCDLLVVDTLLPLWNTPLEKGVMVAAVEDCCSANPAYYSRLHLSDSHRYFNAGVMLANLSAWRMSAFTSKALRVLRCGGLVLDYADQDVLNVLCAGRVRYLPFRYNLQEAMLRRYMPEMRVEAMTLIAEGLASPSVIHFTYILKPWKYISFHPYRRHFFYYLDLTEWSGERPEPTLGGILYRMAWSVASFLRLVNRYHPLPQHMRYENWVRNLCQGR